MSSLLNIKFQDKKFPFYLRRSFYVHLSLILFTLFSGKVILEQRKKLMEKNLQLVEASVRVDMVSMPKFTLNELKNVSSGVEDAKEEAPKIEEKAKAKEEVVEEKNTAKDDPKELALLEESKKKRTDFLSKLKEIGNKKVKGDGNQKTEKGLGGEKATALKDLVLAGNKLSTGVAITGSGNTAEMTAFQVYIAKLPDRVRPHWRLPTFLMNKNLKCRVRVWIDATGTLTHAEVYQTSGDAEYDQRALEAVRSASPYPKLAEEYSKRAKSGDIVLGFPL